MGKLKGVFEKVYSIFNSDPFGDKDERVVRKKKEAWIPGNITLSVIFSLFSMRYYINNEFKITFWICIGVAVILLSTFVITTILYKNKDEALHIRYIDINCTAGVTIVAILTVICLIGIINPIVLYNYGIDQLVMLSGLFGFAITNIISTCQKGVAYVYSNKSEKKIIIKKIIINSILAAVFFEFLGLIGDKFDFSKFEVGQFIFNIIIFLIVSLGIEFKMLKSSNLAAESELEES